MIVRVEYRDPVRLLDYLNLFQNMNGTPPGQHWLLGVGAGTPLSPISPFLLTTCAALGFKIGLE